MDVRQATEPNAASRPDPGSDRAAALAEARRRASADRVHSAEASTVRRAEKIEEYRAAVAEAVGANTRVAITRAPTSPIFLYQAINQETGEVVQQWPRLEFIGLARALNLGGGAAVVGDGVDRTA